MPRHRAIDVVAAAALVLVLVASYRFVPQAFATLLGLAVLAVKWLLVSLALVGWGDLVLRRIGGPQPSPPATAWAAGAVVTATLAGWLGLLWFPDLRFWGPWLAAGLLLAWWERRRRAWRWPRVAGPLLLAAPFALAALLLALAPPVSLDALVYHLALPKQFALAGRIYPMPWNTHAFFPLHAEMLYGLTLAIEPSGRLAQLVHLTAALATLAVVRRLGDRLASGAGAWSGLVLYTLPVLALVSGWAWSDWFVLLYAALALDALFALREGETDAALPMLLFVAAAPAVKYNALPLLGLPVLALGRLRPAGLLAGAALALLTLAPWYGRNWLLTGNPVYPLLSVARRLPDLVGFRGADSGLAKWLGYLGRPDLLDESLGSLLAASLVLGFAWSVRHWRRAWPLAVVATVYLAVAVLHHPTVRAFTPLLLAAALAVGAGLAELWRRGPKRWIGAALAVLLWVNFAQMLWIVREHRPSGVALGYQKTESYLDRQLDVHAAERWINENTPSDAGVLVVGDSRIFHLDRPVIAGSYLDPHPLRGFLRPDEQLPELVARLRRAGIRLVLFNRPHYRVARERQTRDELIFTADPETDAVFNALLATAGEPLFNDRGVVIWSLEAAAAQPPPA